MDLSHIMLIEFEEDYGSFQIPKVVLFNENHVTQEEAMRLVKAGEYHPSVLSIPKRQWEALFLDRKDSKAIAVRAVGWGMLRDAEGNEYVCDTDGYGNVRSSATGELFHISRRDEHENPVELMPGVGI